MEFVDLVKTPMVDDVVLRYPFRQPVEGTLCVTGHHLILSSRRDNTEELWLLHRNVDAVDRNFEQITGKGCLTLKCKNLLVLYLDIPGYENFQNVANSVEWLSNFDEPTLTYPFFYRPLFEILENGWSAFSTDMEFLKLLNLTDEWRMSTANKHYALCSSYPASVVVPKSIDDDILVASANFRQHGRFPVLSYFHFSKGVGLMRSGQPLTGPNTRRCKEDERLLNAVLPPGKRGYIIDTRGQNVAQVAKVKGGGFEPEVHYPQWRRVHKPIDRHFGLLDGVSKLVEACNDTNCSIDKWLSKFESSNWLSHIKDVLNCACLVAQCLDQEETPVLIHGSDGLDSTLQVSSLTQIILDSDCRTIRGFEALIEREWLQAGHPFATRCQRSVYYPSQGRTKNQAPTFLVFLDCVWQLINQFPCSFEFNERFLITLFEHSYASQFGTFLSNDENERKKLKLAERTVSIWTFLNRPENLQTFINPVYKPNRSVIWPSVAPMSLELWSGLFLRWVCNRDNQEQAQRSIADIKEREKELRNKVVRLRRQVLDLMKEAEQSGVIKQTQADG